MSLRTGAAIALGGALGALVRALALEITPGDLGLTLLGVNVIGSFILGFAVVRLVNAPDVLAGVGVGFCGGLTSMSGFALDVAQRLHDGMYGPAAGMVFATVGLTVVGAAVGFRWGGSE